MRRGRNAKGAVMFAGFSQFTWFHTILSLMAIIAGFVVVRDLFASRTQRVWTGIFIAAAALTSATGFGFTAPFGPSHVVGILSLVLLTGSSLALYVFHLAGPWRWTHAITQTLAQFLLVFVLVAQGFKKVPALAAIAPTQSEPPFAAAEGVVAAIFLALAVAAAMRFRPATAGTTPT
jgi:hypothetical protein